MKRRHLLATVFLCTVAPMPLHAAGYPEKPVTIVVPFPAGGASDSTARFIAPKLQEALGQPVVIDNKPGANGGLGSAQVARVKPDGYTLLVGSIGVYAINPVLYPKLGYDPRKDFDLLTVAVRTPNVLVATPNFPASNVQELVAHLKKNPEKVSFATSGAGSSDHLTTALFWQKTGTTGVHIPYKGGAPAITDLIGGHAEVSFQNLGAVANHIKAGKLKLLAVTSDKRVATFPDAPTLTEAGVPGVEVYSWQAVAAPKGLPQEARTKIEGALKTALESPEVRTRFGDLGFEVVGNTSAQFGEFLTAEIARWRGVVDAGKITADQ